jgi:hypothetical protein
VFSLSDCFIRNPDVALRRFPEWRLCYAYTPTNPDLYELNVTAWLIVELCDGRPLADLERAFSRSLHRDIAPSEGRSQLLCGLRALVERGIVICRPGSPTDPGRTRGEGHD